MATLSTDTLARVTLGSLTDVEAAASHVKVTEQVFRQYFAATFAGQNPDPASTQAVYKQWFDMVGGPTRAGAVMMNDGRTLIVPPIHDTFGSVAVLPNKALFAALESLATETRNPAGVEAETMAVLGDTLLGRAPVQQNRYEQAWTTLLGAFGYAQPGQAPNVQSGGSSGQYEY